MSGIKPGPYVVVAVTDTGMGMEPGVAERAIEPFFTTKEVGKGTGLGLSQVYGFVTQSGGHLEIESAPGQGTTVRLYLPWCEGEAVPETATSEPKVKAEFVGTVLIVEDEPDVLEVAVEIFRSLGYDVLTAPDAPAALEILQRDRHIDVLFTDVVMPKGMTGLDLARQARELRPELRVLLASGYPMSALPQGGAWLDEASFISKPYRWTELNDKLRSLR
jgi:CheY-like chemotaxis protein